VKTVSFHISTIILNVRSLSSSLGDRDIAAYNSDIFSKMGRLTKEEK
jgi:hypothetical protein